MNSRPELVESALSASASSSPAKAGTLLSRRRLLGGAVSIGALGVVGGGLHAADEISGKGTLKKGAVILFQGDSITDAGRAPAVELPNSPRALGTGYAMLAAGALLRAYSGMDLQVYNRGISGNKIPDLEARWQKDTLDLKPDILSILIGVNDLWHTFAFGSKYKATIEDYDRGYRALIERTRKALPGVRIVIGEPFTTRTSKEFVPLAGYREAAKRIASDLSLDFVPYQSAFDEAVKCAPAEFWLSDGIHPTPAGHALMVETWRKATGL